MEREERPAGTLDRPYGNGLQANYDKHDVGEQEFLDRLPDSIIAFDWGIDMRGDDGSSGIIYDDKLDFALYARDGTANGDEAPNPTDDGGELNKAIYAADGQRYQLIALVDVKTKGSPDYMGRFNLRHLREYAKQKDTYDVGTYVVMMQVDATDNVVHDTFVFEVFPENVSDSSSHVRSSEASDEGPKRDTSKVDDRSRQSDSDDEDRVLTSKDSHAVEEFPDGNHAVLVPHDTRRSWHSLYSTLVTKSAMGRMTVGEDGTAVEQPTRTSNNNSGTYWTRKYWGED